MSTSALLRKALSESGAQKNLITRVLDTVGDGTGTIEATGNYSAAVEEFFIQPAATEVIRLSRLLISVEDSGNFDAAKYGNGITLSNGIKVICYNGETDTESSHTGQLSVMHNADWGSYCYDVDVKTWGIGNEVLLARWTFQKSGQYLRLRGSVGDKFIIRLEDDFTDLVEHKFIVQGYYEEGPH